MQHFKDMVEREYYLRRIKRSLKRNPNVALLGPQQAGRTMLARRLVPDGSPNYFDLEAPVTTALLEGPMTALAHLRGLVVIDEAQRQPDVPGKRSR